MESAERVDGVLGAPLDLPCGVRLRNRLVKAAMSDSLGDGAGQPTSDQVELYRRWARAGVGLSIIGEVQVDPRYPEKPGNLVLGEGRHRRSFERLAAAGAEAGAHLWPQLGHAGALAHGPIAQPAGPSALDLEGLVCAELSPTEIEQLPGLYGQAALRAKSDGFGGVEVHAGHGFLLSQFLSPLFNRRTDRYGGSIEARSSIIVDIVQAIRAAVGPDFAIGVKINATDQLEGGLTEDDSLVAIEILAAESVDLIDVSGGTYFPGAPASSDRTSDGPYFVDFGRRVRQRIRTPLMVTGGFKTQQEAVDALNDGGADLVGLARALVVAPELPVDWLSATPTDPAFPRFAATIPGGVTAWYTMRLSDIARGVEHEVSRSLEDAVREYDARDADRRTPWLTAFRSP